jgi:predicted nucleotide-binding protein
MTKLKISSSIFSERLKQIRSDGKWLYKKPIRKSIKYGYLPDTLKRFEKSFIDWDNSTSRFLGQAFEIEENEFKYGFDKIQREAIFGDDPIESIKNIICKKLEYLELLPIDDIVSNMQNGLNSNKTKVFIVHGHNEVLKQTVARTLEHLKLEPIILHEQANQGKTIIEKFESNSAKVGFAIILLTADDLGKAKEDTDGNPRARQNVIFEMGYFMGKLGRERVFVLLDDGVEKPSDIDGIVYTAINSNWQLSLVHELNECGYNVDANNL